MSHVFVFVAAMFFTIFIEPKLDNAVEYRVVLFLVGMASLGIAFGLRQAGFY